MPRLTPEQRRLVCAQAQAEIALAKTPYPEWRAHYRGYIEGLRDACDLLWFEASDRLDDLSWRIARRAGSRGRR